MEDMAEFIAFALTKLKKANDPGKRLPIKAPETLDGTFTKFIKVVGICRRVLHHPRIKSSRQTNQIILLRHLPEGPSG